MARTRAATTRKTGRRPNGAGSVVARTLADGSTVHDVFWSYRDPDGNRKRGAKGAFASHRDAEKHPRTVTATVDARTCVPLLGCPWRITWPSGSTGCGRRT